MAQQPYELQRRDDADAVVPWLLVDDPANTVSGKSDPVIDHGARAALADLLTAVGGTLTVDGTIALDAATLAALETITAVVSGTVALDAPSLAALETVSVTGTVRTADAAELAGLTATPFTVTAGGATTLLTPTAGKRLRLRRVLPTLADPDGTSNPLLTLTLGSWSIRSYVLSGRFDVTGGVDQPLTLTLSKAGDVSGTVLTEETD